ncbi:hypothetical protein [Clostridium estertheticum]|uniref:hypothetical protein n=1 Tax=Clostridium estertheticum TaxID=238834 RepID=UPI001CF2920D|nr:hypothetical protein [Clostridium estertheticum]MCB2360164.1 hypothetical protein [Clostridium estertheticum]
MKNTIKILMDKQFREIIENKGSKEIEFALSNNVFEYDDVEEMLEKFNDIQKSFFISQLKIISVSNYEEYNKICSSNLDNDCKVVTNVGNYRFIAEGIINNNILTRRYFIINFNKMITINEEEKSNEIFEINMNSFCILISEICADKQDIEDSIEVEKARKHLAYMEKVIGEFIKKYFDRIELDKELSKINNNN